MDALYTILKEPSRNRYCLKDRIPQIIVVMHLHFIPAHTQLLALLSEVSVTGNVPARLLDLAEP